MLGVDRGMLDACVLLTVCMLGADMFIPSVL